MIARALICAAVAVAAAHAQPPTLAVELENVITQPGNLRLIRPLVLFVTEWSGEHPQARAWTNTGTVTAEITRLPASPDHWNATVRYTVVEAEGAPPATGQVTLRLAIRGTAVTGSFDGRFRDLQLHGDAHAGLTWDYAYRIAASGMLLWLPDPGRPVRAVLLWGDKHGALRPDAQAFAAANNLALIGHQGYFVGEGVIMEKGLAALAETSGHPELARVPLMLTGHSIYGQIAYEFNAWYPGRVLAFTVHKGGAYQTWNAPDAARANPGVIVGGETDTEGRIASIHRLFDTNRPQGALWSLEFEEGEPHTVGRSVPLILFHFQHALDQRLPAGATKPLPVDTKRAWLADNSTWRDSITKIFSADSYKGDVTHLSWLLDRDVAFVYRGIATYRNPLVLARTAGHESAYYSDEPVVLECADFGDDTWKRVTLYDGAQQLGVLTPDHPRITLPPQKPGAHAGVLVGERPDGSLRTSWPVAWVVRPAR